MTTSLTSRVLAAVRADREEILDFTKTLVTIPTENPPGSSYADCLAAIAAKLDEIGLPHEVVEVPSTARRSPGLSRRPKACSPRFCLLSSYGSGKRTVYFHGHYDVVPASSPSQFQPRQKGDYLFGRGAADMKGGLAAMIYAVKAIKDMRLMLGGKIRLVFVPDEETGGLSSRYLTDRGIIGKNGIAMLTPEPTSGVVWNASRGAISLSVTVRGKTAHVGL
jgi:acetylornithine deacetylase/succinyl-diaminopimelate desuccinylase-like protein